MKSSAHCGLFYKHWQIWLPMTNCFNCRENCFMDLMALRWLGSLFHSIMPRTDQAACPNADDLKGILQSILVLARVSRTAVLAISWIYLRSVGEALSFKILCISTRLACLIWFSRFNRPRLL